MGVEDVRVIDPYNIKLMVSTIKELLAKDKVSVIVAKRECRLLTDRRMRKTGIKGVKFEIDQSKCKRVGICLHDLACPAIKEEKGIFKIDKNMCTGCAVCVQVCPNKAIRVVKKAKKNERV
jgi:indolepyruvate ferredoxin oxidoreductase alpha subunit